MKIKLVEKGYEAYTGDYCNVPFFKGVSTREVLQIEADRVGSFIRAVTVTTTAQGDIEKCSGAGQVMLDASTTRMTKVNALSVAEEEEEKGDSEIEIPKAPDRYYTSDELALVADSDGIKGLREIAEFYEGIGGRSVRELVERILRAQNERQREIAQAQAEAAKLAGTE